MILDWRPPVAVACGDGVGTACRERHYFYRPAARPGIPPGSGGKSRALLVLHGHNTDLKKIYINETRSASKRGIILVAYTKTTKGACYATNNKLFTDTYQVAIASYHLSLFPCFRKGFQT